MRGEGSISLASLHAPHYDFMTTTSLFVAYINGSKLPRNIILLLAQDLDKNGLVDLAILGWPCHGLS
jgi:hypothetical protein